MDGAIFVQNIKTLCARKGVKPTVACRESGAGTDLINQVERRGSVPSVERVQLLATYLGVTTSELLGEEKPAAPESGGPDPELWELLSKIPPDRRDEVKRYLRFQAEREGTP